MKNRKRLLAAAAALSAVLWLLVGCQTTIPVSYTEPARLNMSGVRRIAISSDNSQVADSLSERIATSGKYEVASREELLEWLKWNEDRQAIEISSAELVGAYAGNTVRADSSYLGKLLKITAVVKEIGNSRGSYYVRLEGSGNDSVDVFFMESAISGLAAVEKGQSISIVGEGRGFNPPDLEDTAEILRILGAGRSVNIINARFPVEAITVDAVINLKTTAEGQDASNVDTNGNTFYTRSVTVDMGYQVLSRDGSIIGEGTTEAEDKSSNEDASKLTDRATVVTWAINRAVDKFASEIIPTERYASVTLAKESDNQEAKKEMADAEKLAKARKHADAAAAYGAIYARHKNFAAGYNQAVLTEAAAGTEAAIGLMEALYKETSNPLAQTALTDMQSRNASNQRATAQLSQ
jgi:hypothetical protein